MGERRGTKALELWCRRITDGYPGVNVQNMTTSWRDGLAFCAMIHHFRPDLVDFNALNKDDVYGNNEMAFRTAEQHLGIPALLDAEDMASCAVPDRLSILTYLSQFYQTFGGLSPSRPAMKRAKEEGTDDRLASVSGSPQPKVAVRLGVRKEPCVVCGLPVFLAEKLVISRSLYHRTCFRCARCNNQLTLGNYYETEDGQYCCETCPDEEIAAAAAAVAAPIMHQDYNKTALFGGRETATGMGTGMGTGVEYNDESVSSSYKRALSDEEKSSNRKIGFEPADLKSVESSSSFASSRLNFMTSHLLSGNQENYGISPPGNAQSDSPHPAVVDNVSKAPDESDHRIKTETNYLPVIESPTLSVKSALIERNKNIFEDSSGGEIMANINETKDGSVNKEKFEDKLSSSFRDNNQHLTAVVGTHDIDSRSFVKMRKDEDHTKEAIAASGDEKAYNKPGQRLSLVQQRLKIFENSIQTDRGEIREERKVKEEEEAEDGKIMANEQNLAVNISSKNNDITEMDKTVEETLETLPDDCKDSPTSENLVEDSNSFFQPEKESSAQDSSSNIEVEYQSAQPLDLPDEKPITAAVILQKMIDNQEPRRDFPSVDTSLSNVSGVDLSSTGEYPEDLNPFQSDDSDVNQEEKPVGQSVVVNKPKKSVSTNPFGSSDEEEEPKEATPPRPAARRNTLLGNKPKDSQEFEPPARRKLQAPQISLNPFWSDEEDHESDDEGVAKSENTKSTPVPKPRKIKSTPEPSPVPRKTSLDRDGHYASNSSINSTGSLITPGGTYRKKKPAPPPPPAEEMFSASSTFDTLIIKSPDELHSAKAVSPRTPRTRKMKPAPPPPMSTSTPQSLTDSFSADVKETEADNHSVIWDDQKNSKDETNRNRQSSTTVSSTDESSQHYAATFVDKSAQGKWKRKKGPAPPRPLPHKRKIKVMSVKDVKLELDEIELQQQGLEKQGVRLEQLIRDKCETGQENEEFTSLRVDVEELVLELFALVNEKNELFRRQAELMLLRRQQRLEEEHADVEYQIRCLMSQPEATKTDSDKQREETLIQRLVEIVERRNEIVECLEMDRRREVEEDRSINEQMGLFAAKSKGDLISGSDGFHSSSISKKEKVKDKLKEKKIKKSHKKDADKDVDETEMKLKRHKKKWF